jgi:dihydrofolate reductase
MRKIIVSLNTTLDGFMAGKKCELDWHFAYWDEEMARHAAIHLKSADTILLGRVTHQAMSGYWSSRAVELNLQREDLGFAEMMNSHQKIVCSKTLDEPGWRNSTIIRSISGKQIMDLKKRTGKNIIVFGSGSIVSLLMKLELVDELIMWIHPIVLSEGKSAFKNLGEWKALRMGSVKILSSGVVLAQYVKQHQIAAAAAELA